MADLERLSSALRNAHKAGDTEAARKLANAIKGMRAAPVRQAEPSAPEEPEAEPTVIDDAVEVATTLNPALLLARQIAPETTRAFARAVPKGATFGGLDELSAGVQSLGALFTDKDVSDAYSRALNAERSRAKQVEAENPSASIAGELTGAVLNPVTRLVPGGATAGLGTRIAANTGIGAGVGATAGFLSGEGRQNRLDMARTGAAFGGVVGAGSTAAGQAVGNALARRATRANQNKLMTQAPTTEQLRATGSALFNSTPRAQAKPLPLAQTVMNIATRVRGEGIDEALHPKAMAVMRRLAREAEGGPSSTDLKTLREIVSDAGQGGTAKDKRLVKIIRDELDDAIQNFRQRDLASGDIAALQRNLPEARATWAKMKKSEIIDDVMRRASTQASGFENGLRRQFDSILRSDKLRGKFTAGEIEAMEQLVKGSFSDNVLKRLSRLSPGHGQQTNMLASMTGAGGMSLALGPLGPFVSMGGGAIAGNALMSRTARKAALIRAMAATGQTAARGSRPRSLNKLERLMTVPAAAEAGSR